LTRVAEVSASVSVSLSLISIVVRCYAAVSVSEMVNVSGSAREIGRQGGRREECVLDFWTGHGSAIVTPCFAED
jgi:hypothetical protein